MAQVILNDMIREIHGSLSKDSAYYYRRTPSGKTIVCMKPGCRAPRVPEPTPEQIAEQRQKAITEAQRQRRERFARVQQVASEIMATQHLRSVYMLQWRKQKKYPTLRGYIVAQMYELV